MRALATIVLSDLRQRVRDRSVIIFGLVVPMALIGVFSLLFSGIDDGAELNPVTVAVAAPVDDAMADALIGALHDLDVVDVTIQETTPEGARALVDDGDAALGLVLPEDFAASITAGDETAIRVVVGDDDRLESNIVVAVVNGVAAQMEAGSQAATAAAAGGVAAERLEEIGRKVGEASDRIVVTEGEAADEQLGLEASLVAGQAGLFLLFTVGFGALGLINEREQGTLTRLESFPLRPGTVVVAKALSGYVLGVLTTTVLLVAGSLVFDLSWGGLVPVAVLVLCAVAASTSIVFVVARVVATSEQANMAQSIVAMVLGITGGAFFSFRVSGALGTLLELNPVAAFSRGLGITSGGGGLGDLGVPLAVLLGFAVVAGVSARIVPDRMAR